MNLFDSGLNVIKKLENAGFKAFFVGGAVRDYLLDIPFNDIDITTDASISDIEKIFKVVNKSPQYLSVVIDENGYQIEITTFRSELAYTRNRFPEVIATKNLYDDLVRRDFTINAFAMDQSLDIIDRYDGLSDLKNRLIKCIGDANISFEKDALRMIRACYFSAKLDFMIEENTFSAIIEKSSLCQNLSVNRIYTELEKIIALKNNSACFELLIKTKIAPCLRGLESGIEEIVKRKLKVSSVTEFFQICYYYNNDLFQFWNIDKKLTKHTIDVINLAEVITDNNYNRLILFSYGQKLCLDANKFNSILGKSDLISDLITNDYEKLPLKKICDLKFKGYDILQLEPLFDHLRLSDAIDDLKYMVIMGLLDNDYEVLKKYFEKKYLK